MPDRTKILCMFGKAYKLQLLLFSVVRVVPEYCACLASLLLLLMGQNFFTKVEKELILVISILKL